MGIFPEDYLNNNVRVTTQESTEIPLLKEYAINFETGEPLISDDGKFTIVEGLDAVKVRCYLALNIHKGRYFIYKDVGNNLKSLLGKDLSYVNKNIQYLLEDALVDGVYVTGINDITTSQDGEKVTVNFSINSIYGTYSEEKEVI